MTRCPRARGALVLLCMAWVGCARTVRPDEPVNAKSPSRSRGDPEGWASFYGNELKGNRTASGERFDPRDFTAAHRTLPLGSCVEVERVGSGERVQVRVNDRGPFEKRRIIDVSLAAAKKLQMVKTGVARVRLHHCS